MKRFWEIVVTSRGADRFYCFPFLLVFRIITPVYQFFSRRHLLRRRSRRSRDWRTKVISVGGITVGGAGKTPVVGYLAEMLLAQGKKVAVVHSGYGRKRNGDQVVGYGRGPDAGVAAVGDEVAMLARMVPQAAFAVGPDKKRMLARVDHECRPDVTVIDDGYQRLDIVKEVDLAIIPASLLSDDQDPHLQRQFRLFPQGILREPRRALGRADAIGVTGSEEELSRFRITGRIGDHVRDIPLIRWTLEPAGAVCEGNEVSIDDLRKHQPFLFAGIGSYSRLLAMVRNAGIPIAGDYDFGDHFDYDRLDIDMVRRLASSAGADSYLTTAKDLVKLPQEAFDKPLYCLRLRVRPLETETLRDIIGKGLS